MSALNHLRTRHVKGDGVLLECPHELFDPCVELGLERVVRHKWDDNALARWRYRKTSVFQNSLQPADDSVPSRLLNMAGTSAENVKPVFLEVLVSQDFLLNEGL